MGSSGAGRVLRVVPKWGKVTRRHLYPQLNHHWIWSAPREGGQLWIWQFPSSESKSHEIISSTLPKNEGIWSVYHSTYKETTMLHHLEPLAIHYSFISSRNSSSRILVDFFFFFGREICKRNVSGWSIDLTSAAVLLKAGDAHHASSLLSILDLVHHLLL